MSDPEKTTAPILAKIGDTGLKKNSGYIDEEFLTTLKGTKGRKKLREMADNDPNIGAALYLTEALLTGVQWNVEPNKSGHPLAQERADRVEECFGDMESTWQQTVAEMLTALVFGWCVLEPCYKIRRGMQTEPRLNSQFDDGLFGWLDWAPRSQESLERWAFSDEGRVLGMYQRHPDTGRLLFIPRDRWLHYTFRGSKGNPEGRSALRTPYQSYYFANRLREIEAIGIERNVAGMPDIQVPPELLNPNATPAQKQMLAYWESLGKKIRTDSLYCVIRPSEKTPDGKETGYKFGLVSASGRSFADTDPIIRRHEQRMLMSFLDEMLTLGDNGVGSFSMHSDKTKTSVMALGRILDGIDAVTNRDAIPRLCELNGWERETWPTHVHGDIEKTSVLEWTQSVANLVNAGALEADDEVRAESRRLLDLKPTPEIPASSVMAETPVADPSAITPEPIQAAAGPDMLTVDEAADYLRCTRSVVMSAMRRGQLPAAKVGNGWRITKANLDAYLRGAHGDPSV